jgi:hypothetical protein
MSVGDDKYAKLRTPWETTDGTECYDILGSAPYSLPYLPLIIRRDEGHRKGAGEVRVVPIRHPALSDPCPSRTPFAVTSRVGMSKSELSTPTMVAVPTLLTEPHIPCALQSSGAICPSQSPTIPNSMITRSSSRPSNQAQTSS